MSEAATETPATGAPTAEPAAPAEPAQPTQPAPQGEPQKPAGNGQEPPAGQQPAAPAGNADELPPWAQKQFRELRTENAANRVKAKEVGDKLAQFEADQVKQRDAFARALGLKTDEPPTSEQLTEQLTKSQSERDAERDRARQAAVELAVFRNSAAMAADGNALLDSRAFAATLAGLDPAAGDFADQVKDAITKAIEAHPQYKLTPATSAAPEPPAPPTVPKSGPGQFTGAPNSPRQWSEEDVAHASPSQLQEAINKGLLENLGFGPKRASRR